MCTLLLCSVAFAGCGSSRGSALGEGAVSGAEGASLYDRPWRFVDEQGDAVTIGTWRGTPMVLTMFYRACDVRCPSTIRKLRHMESLFATKQVRVSFVLVTLDPRNDTPDRLRDFKAAEGMGDGWHLLQGDRETTREVARLLAVRPAYDDAHIEHDVRIGILNSRGELTLQLGGWNFDDEAAFAALTR